MIFLESHDPDNPISIPVNLNNAADILVNAWIKPVEASTGCPENQLRMSSKVNITVRFHDTACPDEHDSSDAAGIRRRSLVPSSLKGTIPQIEYQVLRSGVLCSGDEATGHPCNDLRILRNLRVIDPYRNTRSDFQEFCYAPNERENCFHMEIIARLGVKRDDRYDTRIQIPLSIHNCPDFQ